MENIPYTLVQANYWYSTLFTKSTNALKSAENKCHQLLLEIYSSDKDWIEDKKGDDGEPDRVRFAYSYSYFRYPRKDYTLSHRTLPLFGLSKESFPPIDYPLPTVSSVNK